MPEAARQIETHDFRPVDLNSLPSERSGLEAKQIDNLYDGLLEKRRDFPVFWGLIKENLNQIVAENSDQLHFGPDYHITTARGETLNIGSIFIESQESDGDPRRDFCLIARDPAGNVAGIKWQNTRYFESENRTDSWGVISLDESSRERGFAMPIELTNLDLLQREANRRNARLTMRVGNGTLAAELSAMEAAHKKNPTEALASKISQMKKQYERWLSIYGYKGRLGINKKRQINFKPRDKTQDLEEISDIMLQRVNGKAAAIIEKEFTINDPESKNRVRQQRLTELKILVKK